MKIPLNECACLVRVDDGSVAVLFEKAHYKRDDLVPNEILGENYRLDASPAVLRAARVVEICMAGKFGPVMQWPTAAAEYVYPPPGHERSEAAASGFDRKRRTG
jgi:hypothetical protein